jgi:hypothetical protein
MAFFPNDQAALAWNYHICPQKAGVDTSSMTFDTSSMTIECDASVLLAPDWIECPTHEFASPPGMAPHERASLGYTTLHPSHTQPQVSGLSVQARGDVRRDTERSAAPSENNNEDSDSSPLPNGAPSSRTERTPSEERNATEEVQIRLAKRRQRNSNAAKKSRDRQGNAMKRLWNTVPRRYRPVYGHKEIGVASQLEVTCDYITELKRSHDAIAREYAWVCKYLDLEGSIGYPVRGAPASLGNDKAVSS